MLLLGIWMSKAALERTSACTPPHAKSSIVASPAHKDAVNRALDGLCESLPKTLKLQACYSGEAGSPLLSSFSIRHFGRAIEEILFTLFCFTSDPPAASEVRTECKARSTKIDTGMECPEPKFPANAVTAPQLIAASLIQNHNLALGSVVS